MAAPVPPGSNGRNEGNGGGYDCEFVERPPDTLQTECPICLHVLREPCLISCPCGQKICRDCVEKIKKGNKPCPLCNKTDFTYMRDYGHERLTKMLDVRCSKKKDGCEWKGRLGEYEQHLNRNPSLENQLTGCQFVEVECKHGCGERFQRRHVISHQNKQCRMRPYSCEYCHDCDSTFEDVTVTHYLKCKKYPVSCPNGCQDNLFERQQMKLHLKEKCPLAQVNCPLHYAGCEVILPRKDLPEHMIDTVSHLTLLATVTQTLLKENEELQKSTQDLKRENRVLKMKARERDTSLDQLVEEVQRLKIHKTGIPIEFRVKYVKDSIFLPSFYTHSSGYHMCVEVSIDSPDISVFLHLKQGKYDDHLKWPFRGAITVQIRNQAGDNGHYEKIIVFNDDVPDSSAGRVKSGNQQSRGWGHHRFVSISELGHDSARNVQFLKDDVIVLTVTKVSLH